MAKILFVNQPTIGHLNPLLAMALQARADGHEVSFMMPGMNGLLAALPIAMLKTAATLPATLASHHLPLTRLNIDPAMIVPAIQMPNASGYRELRVAIDLFTAGLSSYGRQVLKHLETLQPDMLVVDFTFPAASLAAEKMHVPYAIVYHSGLPFSGPLIPPFGSGLPIGEITGPVADSYRQREVVLRKILTDRFTVARQKMGLPPAGAESNFLRGPESPWLNLVTTIELIEAERDTMTDTTFFVGPCIGGRRGETSDFPFDKLRADAYKIYVSLGTIFNNRPHVFRAIMDALDLPGYQVIISAGGAYNTLAAQPIPANMLLFKRVPQIDLLAQVDLVIGHGGNNSTNETLQAGKPLIVLPVGSEQSDNASRVEYLGVGVRGHIDQLQPAEVLQWVRTIQANPSYHEQATVLKVAIDKTNGARTAAALIGAVARNHSPLCRPAGYPLTVKNSDLEHLLTLAQRTEGCT